MRLETVCTGDELLTGLTTDTNSTFFQARLLETLSLTAARNTVVPDVREEIIRALQDAAGRSDAVLVSGGLGPTADDLTAECAALAAGVPLVESAAARRHLEERFKARGYQLTENNLGQARVPQGAEVILNPLGSAPMFVLRLGKATVFFVPGVPKEYRHLVEAEVLPRLARLFPGTPVSRLKLLKTIGLPESHLDAKVRPLFAAHPRVTFGFRTHAPENHLKLLAVAPTAALADAALAAAEAASRAALGAYVFGEGEQSLATVVGAALKARGESVAVAESCTGGRICALLTAEAGASDWFAGGAVPYRDSAKQRWVGVKVETLKAKTAVSPEVAAELAEGARAGLDVTWGLASTGYAGPTGGDAEHPLGTVFLGLARAGHPTVTEHHRFAFPGDRDRVQAFAAGAALDLLRRTLANG